MFKYTVFYKVTLLPIYIKLYGAHKKTSVHYLS